MKYQKRFIRRNQQLSTKEIERELILLTPDETNFYTLNEVGTRVWKLADGKKTVEEIIQEIASEYNISPDVTEKDILAFLEEAKKEPCLFSFSGQPIED